MIHPDDLAGHQATIAAAIASRGGYRSEFRVIRPDTGEIEWREERGFAVTDEQGDLRKLHGVVMDITQRWLAEHALRESEGRLRLAVEAAPVVLFNHDRDLRYTWVGKAFAGFAPDALLGKTDADLFPPEIAEPAMELKRRALETGERTDGEIDLPDAAPGDASHDAPLGADRRAAPRRRRQRRRDHLRGPGRHRAPGAGADAAGVHLAGQPRASEPAGLGQGVRPAHAAARRAATSARSARSSSRATTWTA